MSENEGNAFPVPAAEVIEDFLRDNPQGKLYVAFGYASAYGLSWLDQRTRGRPVWLLVGDIRTGFSNQPDADRLAALSFLERSDVEVRNWYRTNKNRLGKAKAHMKVWMVQPDSSRHIRGAVLVGSANLTRAGLYNNFEMMAEVATADHPRLFSQMNALQKVDWPAENLQERLDSVDGKHRDDPSRTHRAKPKQARPHTTKPPPPLPPPYRSKPKQSRPHTTEPPPHRSKPKQTRPHTKRASRSQSRSGCAQSVGQFFVLAATAAIAVVAVGIHIKTLLKN